MDDALAKLVELTGSFLGRLRAGRAEPGELTQLLLEREQILGQLKDTVSDVASAKGRYDELLRLDEELHRYCREAQRDLARRLSNKMRHGSETSRAGHLVVESA